MKREIFDCDYLRDQKDIKQPIKLILAIGNQMDASGNEMVEDIRMFDLSTLAGEIILNAIVKEFSYKKQRMLWIAISNRELPKQNVGFGLE